MPAPEELFTIAPPPCSSISGISYFIHKNMLRRLMAMIRSHSSSVTSTVTLGFCSAPALLNATSRRPNASTAWFSAACTSWDRVTSQRTVRARPPSSSIIRAVSLLPSSDTSASTTLAPSRAKASAVVRPMPLPAPVTKATLPAKLPFSFVAVIPVPFVVRLTVVRGGDLEAGAALPGVRLRTFPRPRPDSVESFHNLGVQLHGQRAEVRPQLIDRRRSDDRGGDDRVAQQPGQRHLRRLRAQLPAQPFIGFELIAVRLDAVLRRVVEDASLGGSFEQAGMQRAVRDQTDGKAAKRGDQLQLHGSLGEVVQALLGCQTHEVACRGGALGEGHVPAGEVPAADVADLALADQLLHRLPDLRPRRGPVDVVHLVQVDVIGLQPPHARLAGAANVVGRQSAVVRAESHRLVHLRRQDDVVAVPAAL